MTCQLTGLLCRVPPPGLCQVYTLDCLTTGDLRTASIFLASLSAALADISHKVRHPPIAQQRWRHAASFRPTAAQSSRFAAAGIRPELIVRVSV